MAFFELNDPKFDADQIEKEILRSLEGRGIPLEEEKAHLEKLDLETIKKEYYAQPLIRFKALCNGLPRWMIRIAKRFPFYESVRRRLILDK